MCKSKREKMDDTGLSEHHIEIIKNIFKKYPEISKVILYGSRAKGNYKPGSDIDMTIFSKKDFSYDVLAKIWGDFDDSDLPFLVDLSLFSKLTNKNLITI